MLLLDSVRTNLFTLVALLIKKEQPTEYETVPYFLQLSQNLTTDSLLIYLFVPTLQIQKKLYT